MSQCIIGILFGLVLIIIHFINPSKKKWIINKKTRRFDLIFDELIVDNLSINIIKWYP
jgi:hypothetical protein